MITFPDPCPMLGIDLKLDEDVLFSGDEILIEIVLSNFEGLK